MPRRPRAESAVPTCPLCGTAKVEIVGREGIDNQLLALRCGVCERTWNEVVSDQPAPEEDQLA